MAVAVDASSPAANDQTTNAAIVSASFTPPTTGILVMPACVGNSSGSGATTGTASDSLAGTWVTDKSAVTTAAGAAYTFRRSTALTGAAMTATFTTSGATNAKGTLIAPVVLTGVNTSSPTGATASATAATAASISVMPTVVGSLMVMSLTQTLNSKTLTILSGCTNLLAFADSTNGETYGACYRTISSLSPVTIGWSTTAALNTAQISVVEYVPSSGGVVVAHPALPMIVHQAVRRASFW